MKILIATDWYKYAVNGVVTSVKNLEKGLTALGHEVKILTLSQTRRSYIENNTIFIGSVKAEKIYPCARVRIPLKSGLIEVLCDWKPDIIHTQCEFSTFSLARKISEKTGAPIVHTYHTVYEDYTHYFSPSIKLGRLAVKVFTKHIAAQSSCLVAPTEKVKNLLYSYECTRNVFVSPTGLDLDEICCKKTGKELDDFKKKLGIFGKKVILYAGRIAEEKNLEEVIDFLSQDFPENAVFMIVGDGPYKKQIKEKIAESGIGDKTIMTGMVSYNEIKNYYAAADLFVSSSQSETQGLTYIEALANGTPLLCRSDSCLNGVLIEGETGCSYRDREEFSKGLKLLLEADKTALRAKCAALAQRKFSLEVFAKRSEEIYHLILAQKQGIQCA